MTWKMCMVGKKSCLNGNPKKSVSTTQNYWSRWLRSFHTESLSSSEKERRAITRLNYLGGQLKAECKPGLFGIFLWLSEWTLNQMCVAPGDQRGNNFPLMGNQLNLLSLPSSSKLARSSPFTTLFSLHICECQLSPTMNLQVLHTGHIYTCPWLCIWYCAVIRYYVTIATSYRRCSSLLRWQYQHHGLYPPMLCYCSNEPCRCCYITVVMSYLM